MFVTLNHSQLTTKDKDYAVKTPINTKFEYAYKGETTPFLK